MFVNVSVIVSVKCYIKAALRHTGSSSPPLPHSHHPHQKGLLVTPESGDRITGHHHLGYSGAGKTEGQGVGELGMMYCPD